MMVQGMNCVQGHGTGGADAPTGKDKADFETQSQLGTCKVPNVKVVLFVFIIIHCSVGSIFILNLEYGPNEERVATYVPLWVGDVKAPPSATSFVRATSTPHF